MTRLEEMVVTVFPMARPEIDFEFTEKDGKTCLSKWDAVRLGEKPDLRELRKHFLAYVQRKSKTIPTIDTTDPAPWLNDEIEEFEAPETKTAERQPKSSNPRLILTANGTLLRFK